MVRKKVLDHLSLDEMSRSQKIPRMLVYSLTFVVCQRQDAKRRWYEKTVLDHMSLDEMSRSQKKGKWGLF